MKYLDTKVSKLVIAALATAVIAIQVNAQSDSKGKPAGTQRTAEMNAEMNAEMKAASPGAAHQALLKRVGDYTTKSRFIMAPGSASTETSGTARISAALDGRFIVEENTGNLLGMPTRGVSYYGYNNGSKKYEAIWTYTMSTAIMTLVGTSSDGGKTVSYTASYDDATGARQTLFVTTKQIDNDHFIVELVSRNADGTNGPTLEITYVRTR